MNNKFFRFLRWILGSALTRIGAVIKFLARHPEYVIPLLPAAGIGVGFAWGLKGIAAFFSFFVCVGMYQLCKALWKAFCRHEEAMRDQAERRMTK